MVKSQVKKCDHRKKHGTYLAPNVGNKRESGKPTTEVEADANSWSKTCTNNPNPKEGGTEEY